MFDYIFLAGFNAPITIQVGYRFDTIYLPTSSCHTPGYSCQPCTAEDVECSHRGRIHCSLRLSFSCHLERLHQRKHDTHERRARRHHAGHVYIERVRSSTVFPLALLLTADLMQPNNLHRRTLLAERGQRDLPSPRHDLQQHAEAWPRVRAAEHDAAPRRDHVQRARGCATISVLRGRVQRADVERTRKCTIYPRGRP